MTNGLDRFDNEGSGGGGFVIGLLAGTVIGAGLAMLFAPKAGAELRSQLSEQAGNLANTASEGYRKVTENAGQWAEKGRDAAGEWAEKGKDMYGKAREAVKSGADEAQQYVRDAASDVTGMPLTAAASSESTRGNGSVLGGSHSGSTGGSRRS